MIAMDTRLFLGGPLSDGCELSRRWVEITRRRRLRGATERRERRTCPRQGLHVAAKRREREASLYYMLQLVELRVQWDDDGDDDATPRQWPAPHSATPDLLVERRSVRGLAGLRPTQLTPDGRGTSFRRECRPATTQFRFHQDQKIRHQPLSSSYCRQDRMTLGRDGCRRRHGSRRSFSRLSPSSRLS